MNSKKTKLHILKPILSILIATKNRVPYCINAIETILKFEDLDFELIVQDNTDTLELFEYVQNKISDKRFKYNYTPPPFSSIDNFNAVIAMASGEYLCLIGDDDGINPEIFKLTRWTSQNNIDAIVPGLNAIYWWPTACEAIERLRTTNGLIEISSISGSIKEVNTSKEIIKLMKNGGNYLELNMPKLYHGIVKKEFMDKIKEHTGHYVGGLSPDIYTAVALTSFIKKIIAL
ncbi:MAG: glycosyltransferase [Deltaproteobacteria bacterium]